MRPVEARLDDRLGRAMSGAVVGRERELALLTEQLADEGAVVSFVYGIGGIGKSSLLAAAASRFSAASVRVVRLDGRAVEPTPHGFLEALGTALGGALPDIEAVAEEIARTPGACAIVIDEFDRLRLLDSWLMHACLPRLPAQARFFFAGRFAPRNAWLTTPGWSERARFRARRFAGNRRARAAPTPRRVGARDPDAVGHGARCSARAHARHARHGRRRASAGAHRKHAARRHRRAQRRGAVSRAARSRGSL